MPIQTNIIAYNTFVNREGLKNGFTGFLFQWVGESLLDIDEETTSEWITNIGFSELVGSVISDVDGEIFFEFSQDGSTVTHVESDSVVGGPATPDSGKTVCNSPAFSRIRYVNGGVAQASFSLAFSGRRST